MSSSTEPSAERCIQWNDAVADVGNDDDDVEFLRGGDAPHSLDDPASSCVDHAHAEKRIAYDAHDHTQWHHHAGGRTATEAGSSCAPGLAPTGKHIVVLPEALSRAVRQAEDCQGRQTAGTVRLVRLPHPRHGNPCFYLLHVPGVGTDTTPDASQPCLFELQAQGPANDFGQTFIVGDEVLGSARAHAPPGDPSQVRERVLPLALSHTATSSDVLIATPVNFTFLALHALIGAHQPHTEASTWDAWASTQQFVPAQAVFSAARVNDAHTAPHQPTSTDSAAAAAVPSPSSPFDLCGGDDKDDAPERDAHDEMDFLSDACFLQSFSTHSGNAAATTTTSQAPHTATTTTAFSSPPSPTSASPLAYGWWPGWDLACRECPELTWLVDHALTAQAVLEPLCDTKTLGRAAAAGAATSEEETVFYRFSPSKAAAWLRKKVEQVRSSAALADILQIPLSADPSTAAPAPSAPLEVAVAVVAEYVPESFHSYMSAACGVPSAATASQTVVPSSTGAVKRTRTEMEADARQLELQQKAVPKSASVKRLEKAGRPANTPTLMAMFAKKTTATEKK